MTYHISQISGARSGEIPRQIEGDAPEGVPGGVSSGPGGVDSGGALDEMTLAPLASSAQRGARAPAAPAAPAAPPGASVHAEAEVDALSLDELRSLIAKAGLPL